MSFSKGKSSISKEDILSRITETQILYFYLGISEVPSLINSPLREDNNPSFNIFSSDGVNILYKDFATKESGNIYKLLSKMWNTSYQKTLDKIYNDVTTDSKQSIINSIKNNIKLKIKKSESDSIIECITRNWEQHDIDFWNSYGITIEMLNYADVYPISKKIVSKDNNKYIFKADKYAYAYVERKENKVTLKIYQPYNKEGFKWSNKHDNSVISLWTKIPEYGENLCICSSLKDALCLWGNIGIPCIAPQGEGYKFSNTAVNELKRRYKNIYILYDNDKTGIEDALSLSKETGFTNIILPNINNNKDISDLRKDVGKESFIKITKQLFNK